MRNGPSSFADLVVVLCLTVVAAGAVAIDWGFWPLRVLLGMTLVLFLPGYVLVATLYPDRAAPSPHGSGRGRTLGGLERVVLSVLLSVCIVPLLALGVDFTHLPVAREPVLGVVVAWVGAFTIAASVMRLRLPADHRFRVEMGGSLALAGTFLRQQPSSLRSASPFTPQNDAELFLNGLVAVGVLVLVASVGFAAVADPGGESFTELYLLSENDDGELVAEGFDTTYAGGEAIPLTVAVGNHEGASTEYTGVVLLQRTADGGATVESTDELERFDVTVADGETELVDLEAMPSMAGEDLRLRVLLYVGDVPDDPSADDAYRSVHIDVTVDG